MPSSISRGPITTRLITELETEGFPVGDNTMPTTPYGWQGEPNETTSSFTPWMSIAALTATPQTIMSMGDTGTEWRLAYAVFYAGISRKQCEALGDRMRNQLTNIAREAISTDTGSWRIQKVSCSGIGASTKVGSAYPDYFSQTDIYEVWITKER